MKIEGGARIENDLPTGKTNETLVSIITISYNSSSHIKQTIESVLEQSYPAIEYIIVDGGSTDGTLDIIKSFGNQIDYWVSEPDRGISDAFNKGIKLARGEIIGMINSDDWYEPDAVRNAVNQFTKDVDIVYGRQNYRLNDKIINVKGGNHTRLLNGLRGMTLPHPASFIRKSLYNRIGLYDISYKNAMDFHFFLRAAKAGARFKKTDSILTNFRSGGVTSNQRLNSLKEEMRAKKEVLGFSAFKLKYQFYIKRMTLAIMGPVIHRLNLDRYK